MINSSIFKSYDVRGIYPSELNEEAAFAIGQAFIAHTGAKKVAVGHDARLSSPALFKSLAEGIISQGADVYDIGQVPTECSYFGIGNYDEFDAAIMITASHNPKEYNGFKMMVKKGNDIVWVRGKDLLSLIGGNSPVIASEAKQSQKNILQDYVNYVLKFSGNIKPFKIVIDASNGVIGKIITMLEKSLPCEIIPLNFQPDGNFPNHSPNPLEADSSNQIKESIQKNKTDFGFIFDADADRIFLVDEKGEMVSADITLLLLAKHFLAKNPGMGIAYNLICSRSVPEFIKKWGGVPIRTQVGFVNVREGLINNNGIMGGELSAHYCFKDYFYCDSGMIAFLTLLQIISKEAKPVSEIVKELTVYAKPAQLTFKIDDQNAVLEKVKEKYIDGKQDFLDGVTVEYKDWWFNLRPSNTEPVIKLTIEASTQELLEEKQKELTAFLDSVT
jgi:phosphomannomutase